MFILGTIFLPLTSIIFRNFKCNGYIFSKVIGIGISGLTMWLLSYLKLFKYTSLNAWIIILIYLLLNIYLFIKNKQEIKIDKNKIKNILIFETIFMAVFFFWSYVKSFSPAIDFTTEKYMNYGFLNVLYNSDYMPAQDMWFSGNNINYYYFGQYLASFLSKLSFSNINEGFNLFVAMINAFTFMLPFVIGYNIGNNLIKNDKKFLKKKLPIILALLCGLAIAIGGTLYYPIYGVFMNREENDPYYYWEDTRYIGYRPETNDKTINEIVPYSNLVGDLHAHHIDTMFVFLTLALLLQLLLDNREKTLKQNLTSLNILFLGIILGIQKMTNYWDFPIYLVVISLTIIFNNLMKYKFTKKTLLNILVLIFEIVLIEELVTLPFTKDLYMSATKVFLTHVTSPFYKMLVLWGLPTFLVLYHVINLIVKFIKQKSDGKFLNKLSEYISKINKADLFIFIIGCSAIGLIIIPEIVYVKDIYGEEFKRANTVYKLCYQAEIMFDISASYILIKTLYEKNSIIKKIITSLVLIAFISTFGYGLNGIKYATNSLNINQTKLLTNTEEYIKNNYPLEYEAINYIKGNIDKEDIILEKTGGSYNYISYVSVFTGNPTVLGWHGHEWIWRADKDYSSPEEENRRWNDVHSMYSNFDVDELNRIIKKYNISYIYASSSQGNISNIEVLKTLGNIVFERENTVGEFVYIIDVR